MRRIVTSLFIILLFLCTKTNAQDDNNNSPISVKADIVSTYLWRGISLSPTPNIQPTISFSKGKFEVGFWGSTDFIGKYKEFDIYASYSISGFSAILTDYYSDMSKKYFDYDNKSTGHQIELALSYELNKIPLQLYVGTIIYGADKRCSYYPNEPDSVLNDYSTYIELNYTLEIKQVELQLFAGLTPATGMYGNGFSFINTGLTATRKIKITSSYSLPIFATFAVNPQKQDYFVVFGISL